MYRKPWRTHGRRLLFTTLSGVALASVALAFPAPAVAECSSIPGTADPAVLETMYRTATGRQVTDRVMLTTFEAGWVESHMNNLPCGDLDSLGVFQQRSHYGSAAQRTNVEWATNAFLDRAIPVAAANPSWTAGRVAQEVQRSAFPGRYDQAQATALELIARARSLVGPSLPVRPLCYAVSGDWDGNGSETIGAACKDGSSYRWSLMNGNSGGSPAVDSHYGNSDSCLPVTGDWDGDGADTIGVACKDGLNIRWSLVNAFQGSPSYPVFGFGNSNDCWPVTGDWNGNGSDTAGIACRDGANIRWGLMNIHAGGTPQETGRYGASNSCRPVTGDWNSDGTDTVGVACRDGLNIRWSLVNAVQGSPSYPVFGFGNANDCQPVTGDWNGNGSSTVGIACIGHQLAWRLMNVHEGGTPQESANFGNGRTYQPTAGWGGPNWPTWPHN
jgi:hypothetical protein